MSKLTITGLRRWAGVAEVGAYEWVYSARCACGWAITGCQPFMHPWLVDQAVTHVRRQHRYERAHRPPEMRGRGRRR